MIRHLAGSWSRVRMTSDDSSTSVETSEQCRNRASHFGDAYAEPPRYVNRQFKTERFACYERTKQYQSRGMSRGT